MRRREGGRATLPKIICHVVPSIDGKLHPSRFTGPAAIADDAAQLASFSIEGKAPPSLMVITLGEVYFQCAG